MVLGCLVAFKIEMLKRRASKRFVLGESGQDNIWDSSVDNSPTPNITVDRNANDTNMSTQGVSSESTSGNHLAVPKTTAVEPNQGLK